MLNLRRILLPLVLAAVMPSCTEDHPSQAQTSAQATGVESAEARRLVAAGAVLLDVRSPGEFQSGHPAPARNIPVDELEGRMSELPRDKTVVVYCLSGGRSRQAAAMLSRAGYTVRDLGTVSAW